ncbi:uncharacterized protein Tco025E_06974 [Trypanosoma conorhini]|uniref:Uncharacterized protein n=1 Tax=Trypanosoma conorhini TaxID=83891 RepID=A0A422NW81_9TRYP|nr:uncharacterized protein Tco025E_06974 [Trypanosoma conorhini]RNF09753.1 hypothetical protein Tco025E_06974 [Trypanosoma conorhini]
MDVAEFLSGRAEEVEAFSALLFRKRPREEGDGGFEPPLPPKPRSVVQYRRPSSANVPLSDVVRLAKFHSRRSRRFGRLLEGGAPLPASTAAVDAGQVQKKKRPLTYKAWCLLLRRRRRLAWRRRATARRRMRRRHIALRHGKMQLPLCTCGSSAAAAAPPPGSPSALSSSGGRTAVLWLPSHWRLCRRFHYGVVKTRVDCCPSSSADDGVPPRLPTVRVAVPMKCRRKQHRVLQRWAARLPSCSAQAKPYRRPECKPMAVPPPLCFAAERSHVCVWTVQPRKPWHSLGAKEVLDLLMLRTNGAPPAALHTRHLAATATSQVNNAPQEAFWQRCEDGVFYGHMWSLRRTNPQATCLPSTKTGPSDSDAAPIVVPVKLLRNGDADGVTYLLVASAPVQFGARAKRKLKIQLISHWNPCGAAKPMCSMFELWCCADALRPTGDETPSETDASVILQWIRRRVNAAVGRWRRAKEGASATQGEEAGKARPSSLLRATTVCCFPSLPTTVETIDHLTFPVHRCVMSILVVSAESSSQWGSSGTLVWRNCRQHFQFARHLFASLTDSSATAWRTTRREDEKMALAFLRCQSLGYTRNVRVIGEEERETLLRLIGCPAFADVSGANASFQVSRMARLRCSPSNAHRRVLLKFAAKGGREHQREGSSLFALKPGNPAELLHIGALTSAPFFSMRFGARVAYAWVWDDAGWELAELHTRDALRAAASKGKDGCYEEPTADGAIEHRDASSSCGACFLLSAAEKVSRILPFLSNAPVHVPGWSAPSSPLQGEKQQHQYKHRRCAKRTRVGAPCGPRRNKVLAGDGGSAVRC